jgi:hypothetical protein
MNISLQTEQVVSRARAEKRVSEVAVSHILYDFTHKQITIHAPGFTTVTLVGEAYEANKNKPPATLSALVGRVEKPHTAHRIADASVVSDTKPIVATAPEARNRGEVVGGKV